MALQREASRPCCLISFFSNCCLRQYPFFFFFHLAVNHFTNQLSPANMHTLAFSRRICFGRPLATNPLFVSITGCSVPCSRLCHPGGRGAERGAEPRGSRPLSAPPPPHPASQTTRQTRGRFSAFLLGPDPVQRALRLHLQPAGRSAGEGWGVL